MSHQNIRPKKRWGQNFLIDNNILKKIADLSGVNTQDTVVEIGSGYGNLTKLLCQKAKFVYAVDIDKELCSIAKDNLAGCKNVKIVNKDFLKVDLKTTRYKVVANLPYYITTPIIFKLLDDRKRIDEIFITIQKEVAQRLVGKPGTKDYSALTCAVNFYTEPKILLKIPKTCFLPKPEVDSCLVGLRVLAKPAVNVKDENLMFKIIRASFNQRRKTILNALSNARSLQFSKAQIQEALADAVIDPKRRGETFSLQDFAALSNLLDNR